MRKINAADIASLVREMCMEANYNLNEDIKEALIKAEESETSEVGKGILADIIKNAGIAEEEKIPICQDTGMAVVFLEIGQDVHITGGDLYKEIDRGVREGYAEGYLRKSVVGDPLRRKNTEDNTPAVIYTDIVPGESIQITIAPKGFGSENMSAVRMLKPSDGEKGVLDFVVDTIRSAGGNPCPPLVVGVGIGGTMDKAALLAKRALLRDIRTGNEDEYYAGLECLLFERINSLGIGPQGLGGKTTVLGVNIETFPTHIAGLPVAVNICCHVARHVSRVL